MEWTLCSISSPVEINPRTKELFEIVHYADTVKYSVDGFLNKNKNTLNADVGMLLSISGLQILNQMAEEGTPLIRMRFRGVFFWLQF